MKLFVFAVCVIAVAVGVRRRILINPRLAATRALPALEHIDSRDSRGQYNVTYSTAEGIQVYESGRLVPTPDGEGEYLQVEGKTRYRGPDGKVYITKYISDLNGTRMEGDHIPSSG